MARIIYGETQRLKEWAVEHYQEAAADDDTHAIGLEDDAGNLQAVVLYNCFAPPSCSMHVVSDGRRRWLSREFLAHVFAYPFIQLGLSRVTAYVPAKNTQALMMDMRLGFQVEGRMVEAMPDDDLIVLGMLSRNCKWLPEGFENGR